MFQRIKKLIGILLVLFLIIVLLIGILTIWDFITNQVAKDALIKVAYTFGAMFVVSLIVIFITKSKE